MAEEKKVTKKAPAKKEAAPKKETVKKEKAPKAPKEVKVEKKAKKEAAPEKPAVTEARASALNVRTTPRKVRLVIDLVRGKDVNEALALLARTNKAASPAVSKLIASAAANATNNFGMDKNLLYVASIQVSDGIRMKRYTPRAKGSASPLIKRNSNVYVVVKERK